VYPVSTEVLQPSLADQSVFAQCAVGAGNEVRLSGGVDPDAPIVVLEEEHLGGVQPPQPMVAIWPDGRILFTRPVERPSPDGPRFEHLQGTIPVATVEKIIRDVAAKLSTVPHYTSTYAGYHGQITRIVVRDGARWRGASVFGETESGFLAAAAGERDFAPPERQVTRPAQQATSSDVIVVGGVGRTGSPPRPFAEAYRDLLAARPDRGAPFTSYEFDVVFFPVDPYWVDRGAAVEDWPRELPNPPPTLAPEQCDSYEGCRYVLDAKYNDAVKRLGRKLRDAKVRLIFVANQKQSMLRLVALYRGERSIDALTTCSGHFGTTDGSGPEP